MVKKARQRPKLEGVASAERVLAVLTAFRRGDDALELTELARRTSLVKSTIMRLCISLEKFDLVERLDDGRYRLGVEAARIGSVYQQSFAMEERIVPSSGYRQRVAGNGVVLYTARQSAPLLVPGGIHSSAANERPSWRYASDGWLCHRPGPDHLQRAKQIEADRR